MEEALAVIFRDLLQIEPIGREDHFFELGGHSLLVLKAVVQINQAFHSALRVTDLYKHPTIRGLAARISGRMTEDELVDLAREAVLDERIVPCPGPARVPAEKVLLTGSTGFVGRFMLAQLLRDTRATIYCLVRAPSRQQGLSRLRACLARWGLWQEEFGERIVAVPGDLRLLRLGMDEVTYQMLKEKLDGIYHCGASMNHLETYAMAKAANVQAARELLQLATHERPKVINYISTLGVFSASTTIAPRSVSEETVIDHERHWHSRGYTASKWVAEKIFMTASERGVPCNVFRVGLVWADTKQGRYDELQHVYRHLKSCLLSGYGVRNYRYEMPPTPVDYVARAIAYLGGRHAAGLNIFHISSPSQTTDGVFERCNALAGTALELLPADDWIHKIKQLHHQGLPLPLGPLLELHEQQRVAHLSHVRFDCTRTHRELERVGIGAPALNDDLLRITLDDMLARDSSLQELIDHRNGSCNAHRK